MEGLKGILAPPANGQENKGVTTSTPHPLQGILPRNTAMVSNMYNSGYASPESTFTSRFNAGLVPGVNPNSVRRDNQKWYDLAASASINTLSEVGLGTLEGLSYMADLEQWKNMFKGTETEYDNFFAEKIREYKDSIKQNVAPVYTDERDSGFNPASPYWWADNLPTVGSTLSMMIPSFAATKAVGAIGKLTRASKLTDKLFDATKLGEKGYDLLKGANSAVFSRYIEGTMEANQAGESAYQTALKAGKSEDEARLIAGEAAAGTFNKNLALLGFDMFQYGKFFKTFDAANSAMKVGTKKLLGDLAKQSGSEGLEEIFQYISGKESEREALINHDALKDDRGFAQRLGDYAKDPDMWTSGFFGALGGGVFGGIGEISAARKASARRLMADAIKPSVEEQNIILKGNERDFKFHQDEAFANHVIKHAQLGTLDKASQNIEQWVADLGKKSDEELAAQGFSREALPGLLQERKAEIETLKGLWNSINSEGISEALKKTKLSDSIAKFYAGKNKKKTNVEFESLLNKIAEEKTLPAELVELNRAGNLMRAYRAMKNDKVADMYKEKIDGLYKQIKQLYPDMDIKETLSHPENSNVEKLATDYARLEQLENDAIDRLSRLSDPKEAKKVEEEYDAYQKASDEAKYNDIISTVNPNTSLTELNRIEKVAETLGKKDEFTEFKQTVSNKLKTNAGFVDFGNFRKSLEERYAASPLLADMEFNELSKILGTPGVDIDTIEQDYLRFPNRAKLIEEYYSKQNELVVKELNDSEPEFTEDEKGSGDPKLTEDIAHVSQLKGAQLNPFNTVGEQFKMIPLLDEKGNRIGWKTEYGEDGNPVPAVNVNNTNWEEVNKPEFAPAGTVVHYEYNPNSLYNKGIAEGKFTHKNGQAEDREIEIVVYKDNNILNKLPNNRIVIGTTRAFNKTAEWTDQESASSLQALRQKADEIIQKLPAQSEPINLGITSKVVEKLPGRPLQGNTLNAPHEIVHDDEPLLYGIVRYKGKTKEPYLYAPGLPVEKVSGNFVPGRTYIIVKNANGQLAAVRMLTRKMSEVPESLQKAKDIIGSIKTKEDFVKQFSALRKVVGFPYGHIKFNNGVVAFLNGEWKPLNNLEVLGDLIAQVDVNQINKGDYNETVSKAGVLYTNLSPNNHFHSAKFTISKNWVFSAPTEIQESKEILDSITGTQNDVTTGTTDTTQQGTTELPNKVELPNGETITKSNAPTFGGIQIMPADFDNGDPFMKQVLANESYTPWNQQQELGWWNENLPNVPVEVKENLNEIYQKGGALTWGVFHNAGAFIWNNAGAGTAYHEAFHAVFNLYHTEQQRKQLFDEWSSTIGSSRTNERQLEEEMADAFGEYVMSKQQSGAPDSLMNRVKKFFSNLYQLLKSLFTDKVSVNDLYSRINNGFYANKEFVYKNNPYWNNKAAKFKLFVDPRRREIYVRFINTQFFRNIEYLRTNQEGYSNLTDIEIINKFGRERGIDGITAMYDSILNQLVDEYNKIKISAPGSSREQQFINDKGTGILQNYGTIKNSEFTETGDYLISAVYDLARFGLKVDLIKKGPKKEVTTDTRQEEARDIFEDIEESGKNYSGWEFKMSSVSGKETLSYEVRKALNMTADMFVDAVTGQYKERVDPLFKMPVFMKFDEIYNYLERNLADIYDPDLMMARLSELRKYKPGVQSIINKLDNDKRLRSQFFSNFAKAHIHYTGIQQKKYKNVDRATGEDITNVYWRVYDANRGGVIKMIQKDWITNFRNPSRSLVDEFGVVNKEKGTEIYNKFKDIIANIEKNRNVSEIDRRSMSDVMFSIGIDISPEELNSINVENTVKINDKTKITLPPYKNFVNNLVEANASLETLLLALKEGVNPFADATIETKALKQIGLIKLKYNNELIQSAFRNADGENMYSHQNPTFFSKLIADMQTNEYEKYLSDPYFRKNKWVMDILSNKEFDQFKPEYTYIDGLKYDGDETGTRYTRLNSRDFEIVNLNMWLNDSTKDAATKAAWYRLPVLADSPTLGYFKFKKYSIQETIDALYDVAVQETDRIAATREENAKRKQQIAETGKSTIPIIENYHRNTKYIFLDFLNDAQFDITNKEEVTDIIRKWIADKFETETKNLRQLGVLTGNSLGENIGSQVKYGYAGNEIALLEHYFHNQVLANTMLFQMLHSDAAFYKPSDLYAGKRNNQVTKPGSMLDTSAIRPEFNSIFIEDIIEDATNPTNPRHEFVKSTIAILESLKVPQEQIDHIVSQYSDINTTDGQAYITVDRWREIQIGRGLWTKNYDKMYQRLIKGEATPKDLKIILQPIKPFYFNHHLINNRIVPIQNKSSEAVLLPQLVNKSPKLRKLLEFMDKNDVDSAQFVSVVKVGRFGATTMAAIENGTAEPIIHQLSNKHYVVQQEVPEHHLDTDNIFGTQIRKLILGNIGYSNIYKINDEVNYDGKQITKLYNRLIRDNVISDFNEVAAEFNDLESLSKAIRREVRDRKLGRNFEELAELEYDNFGKPRFKYPLFIPSQSRRTQALLSAMFKNMVTKQKINGGSLVLVANHGFSDKLNIVFDHKNKVIEYMEVYMPWTSEKFAPTLDNGEIDMSKIDKDLLDAIGFRIPTESEGYSVKRIKVKRFTPKEMGGIVILPSEITKIAGEDFDIDKLMMMLPAFEVVDGRAKKIKYDYNVDPKNQSRAARDNALIDIIKAVWSSPTNTQEILTPGGTDLLKQIRKDMGFEQVNETVILPSQQRKIFERNMTGANLIGVFALHNTNHAVTRHFDIKLAKKQLIKFDGHKRNKFNEMTDIGFERELLGQKEGSKKKKAKVFSRISRYLATLVSASVDNAKEPILNDLNINEHTVDILATILRVGYPMETALYFLNQPAVRKYIFRLSNSTAFGKEETLYTQLMNEYKAEYVKLGGDPEFEAKGASNFSTKRMLRDIRIDKGDPIRKKVDGEWVSVVDEKGAEYFRRQMRILSSFNSYKYMSKSLSEFVRATRADTQALAPSIAESITYVRKANEIILSEDILGAGEVFDPSNDYSMISTFHEYGHEKPLEILNGYYPFQNPFFQGAALMAENNKGADLRAEELEHINTEIFKYYMTDFFGTAEYKDLVENLPGRLAAYKEKAGNDRLGLFQIISMLKIQEADADVPVKRIAFHNNVSITNEQKNDIMDSWEFMAINGTEEERKLANDLIKYSFFTSGYLFTPQSFGHLVPHTYLRELTNSQGQRFIDALYSIQEQSMENETVGDFFREYVRNHFEYTKVVPKYWSSIMDSPKRDDKKRVVSFRVKPVIDPKHPSPFLGTTDEGTAIFKDYIAVTYNTTAGRRAMLYKYQGLSLDATNYGVYSIVESKGISEFASEYKVAESAFEINKIGDTDPTLHHKFIPRTLETTVDGTSEPTPEDTDDAINKCGI